MFEATTTTIEIDGKKIPRPIRDRVLIKQAPKQDKIGHIYTPQGSEEYPDEGVVLAVGEGSYTDAGVRIPLDVKVGDRVMFKRKPSSAINYDREIGAVKAWNDLIVLPESYILLILEP